MVINRCDGIFHFLLPEQNSSSAAATIKIITGVSSIQIIIIVLAVVLAVGVIVFMVSHYKMGARSWSDRWTRTTSQQVSQTGQQHHHHNHPSSQNHRHHLQHHDNRLDHNITSTTAVYVHPQDDRISHEVALFRERQIRLQSVQAELDSLYPPSISLPDGEEYPYGALRHLHLRNAEQESELLRECIRPPPNRTIYESESPPPYERRACSMGKLHSYSSASTISLTNNGALKARSNELSTPLVMRCQSMSTNNCNCNGSGHHNHHHHHSSSSSSSSSSCSKSSVGGGGSGNSGKETTPVSHHLRIARLVNSRPSNAASSTSLPASSTSTTAFCSFCDSSATTATSFSSLNHNNGHGSRCPNGTVCVATATSAAALTTAGCCRYNLTKTEQRLATSAGAGGSSGSGASINSRGSSSSCSSGGGGGGNSSGCGTTAMVNASSATIGHTKVTDNLNGGRHQPVTLTLSEDNCSKDREEDRNRNCSSACSTGSGGGTAAGNAGV